ncbi:MAG: anti-sigma factor family protein [Actinomycetota bacterium]
MTHPEEHLSGYVDGTLGTDERAEVDAHLATCATCREEIELSTRALTMLRELPDVLVPFGTTRPVMAEAGKERASRGRRSWGRGTQWAAGLAAAAVLVAVVAVALPRVGEVAQMDSAAGGGAQATPTPAPGMEAATSGAVPLELQPNADYDATKLERLADSSAQRSTSEITLAAPSAADASAAQAEGATACLARPGGLTGRDRLVRLIQATFEGTPAYLGVYRESPGAGQPADRIVIWVVDRRDCSILSFSSKLL